MKLSWKVHNMCVALFFSNSSKTKMWRWRWWFRSFFAVLFVFFYVFFEVEKLEDTCSFRSTAKLAVLQDLYGIISSKHFTKFTGKKPHWSPSFKKIVNYNAFLSVKLGLGYKAFKFVYVFNLYWNIVTVRHLCKAVSI